MMVMTELMAGYQSPEHWLLASISGQLARGANPGHAARIGRGGVFGFPISLSWQPKPATSLLNAAVSTPHPASKNIQHRLVDLRPQPLLF